MNAYLRAASLAALAVCAGGALLSSAVAQDDAPPAQVAASDILPHEALEAASAYAGFMRKASAISAHFDDSAAIVRALDASEGYEPGQLQQGLIAYAALVAIDDPRFAEGVRAAAPDPESREQLVAALMADPSLAQRLPGSADAVQLVSQVLRAQAQGLAARGDAIRQASYDIQLKAPWSTRMTPDPEQRLANAKLISATRVVAAPDDITAVMAETRAEQAPVVTGGAAAGPLTPTMARSLALAAIAIAGTPQEAEAASQAMLGDASAGQCLHMAKLNLYQCLAVAGPHYEDMFCMGRHAMMETAQCVSEAAGTASAPSQVAYAPQAPRYSYTPAYASAPRWYAQPVSYSRPPARFADQSPAPSPSPSETPVASAPPPAPEPVAIADAPYEDGGGR